MTAPDGSPADGGTCLTCGYDNARIRWIDADGEGHWMHGPCLDVKLRDGCPFEKECVCTPDAGACLCHLSGQVTAAHKPDAPDVPAHTWTCGGCGDETSHTHYFLVNGNMIHDPARAARSRR